MKRKGLVAYTPCFIIALAALLFTVFPLQDVSAKTYRMKIQSAFPRGDLSMDLLEVFAESADKNSNGEIKIKVFAEPEIVPGDQLFGSTKQGVVTMLHGMGGIWSGMVPAGNVEFNLPLAYKMDPALSFSEKAEVLREFLYNDGIIDILREEYAKHGLYFLDIHTYGPVPFVLSTKDVKECSDLKGMKIKADGINRAFHSGIGMVATDMSPTETYMGLKLGTIDAAEWDVSAVTGLKWHEVAPYWVQGMESDHTMGHILVSMKKWKALPENIQKALHVAAKDYWYATVAGYEAEVTAVEALIATGEVKLSVLSESCQAEYMEAAKKIWVEVAAEDPANAKMIEIIKKWRGVK